LEFLPDGFRHCGPGQQVALILAHRRSLMELSSTLERYQLCRGDAVRDHGVPNAGGERANAAPDSSTCNVVFCPHGK
jgi:hypothetical protein